MLQAFLSNLVDKPKAEKEEKSAKAIEQIIQR